MAPDLLVPPDEVTQPDDALLQFRPVVDMDMACHDVLVALIDFDDGIEQRVDAGSVPADGRTDRHAEQPAQLVDVEAVAFLLQFVVHVQRHHHPEVHVDELGGQVEVAFQVGGVHHVDDDIGHLLDEVLPHVQFFRGIG